MIPEQGRRLVLCFHCAIGTPTRCIGLCPSSLTDRLFPLYTRPLSAAIVAVFGLRSFLSWKVGKATRNTSLPVFDEPWPAVPNFFFHLRQLLPAARLSPRHSTSRNFILSCFQVSRPNPRLRNLPPFILPLDSTCIRF